MKMRKAIKIVLGLLVIFLVGFFLSEIFFISYFKTVVVKNAVPIFILSLALLVVFTVKVVFDVRIINKIYEQNERLKEEKELVVDSLYLVANLAVVLSMLITVIIVECFSVSKGSAYTNAPYCGSAVSVFIVYKALLKFLKSKKKIAAESKEELLKKEIRSRVRGRYKYVKPRKR